MRLYAATCDVTALWSHQVNYMRLNKVSANEFVKLKIRNLVTKGVGFTWRTWMSLRNQWYIHAPFHIWNALILMLQRNITVRIKFMICSHLYASFPLLIIFLGQMYNTYTLKYPFGIVDSVMSCNWNRFILKNNLGRGYRARIFTHTSPYVHA
jgi:hypothetical protein